MRVCAYHEYEATATGVVILGDRVVSLDDLNDALGTDYGPDVDTLLARDQWRRLAADLASERVPKSGWRMDNLRYEAPLRHPSKIWGVGLNFASHAQDLAATPPDEPGSWMRPATTLAGAGAKVTLPDGVGRVTAEAEIGVVIGKRARNLETVKEAREAVFGFTPVLDLTAEELLQRNPRNLTRAKSYDGFCVVGPFVTTVDEWEPRPDTRIVTRVGSATKEGHVRDMRHDPYELVRFFSHVFTWEPGDILLTGTPGAITVATGSTMRAEIDGLAPLEAHVA